MKQKFLWGMAISGHQTEGGDENSDWSEFEKNPKNILDGSNTKSACDFWNRFEEDIQLAKNLGANCLRLSIEWSRIQPEPDFWDEEALKHYQKIIQEITKNNLEPIVSLWHFTLPLWVAKIGGWKNPQTSQYFSKYVQKIISQIKGVKFWLTINEPGIYAGQMHIHGAWPPRDINGFYFFRILNNLAKGHCLAYQEIKKIQPQAKVSFAHHWVLFEGLDLLSKKFIKIYDWFWNLRVFNKFQPVDFQGINFYSRYGLRLWPFPKRIYKKNSFIPPLETKFEYVESDPDSLYFTIKDVWQKLPQKPILVTEHGVADNKDFFRPKLVRGDCENIVKLLKENIPLIGVCHWSLLDNFEWAKGYTAKFGLVKVDRKTLQRKVKKSGWEFKKASQELKKLGII